MEESTLKKMKFIMLSADRNEQNAFYQVKGASFIKSWDVYAGYEGTRQRLWSVSFGWVIVKLKTFRTLSFCRVLYYAGHRKRDSC